MERLAATVGSTSPPRRARRIQNGSRSCNAASFWPSDKPAVTDINKGRRPSFTPPTPQSSTATKTLREKPALSEGSLIDRPIVLKILDRITARGEQSYVRKVLRSYDSTNSGFLSKDALRTAMDRLALGLDEHGKSKVVARLDPDNSNRIPVDKLVTSFEDDYEPLGLTTPTDRRLAVMTRPPFNTVRRCVTPCGMSKSAEGLAGYSRFSRAHSRQPSREGSRDLQSPQSSEPLASQFDIQPQDVHSSLSDPKTYALQQQLLFKGPGPMQHGVFKARDAHGKGRLPLDALTQSCQEIVPGIQPRDVAALVVALEPSNKGLVNYRHFVSGLLELSPAHEKLLKSGTRGFETEHEKWGLSPITRQPPPITPGSRFPTTHLATNNKGPLSSTNATRHQAALMSSRGGGYASDLPTGSGQDFSYGQPDVFDTQGEVDERKLVHAVSVEPMLSSLAGAAYRSPASRGSRQRSAFLSSSMPEMPTGSLDRSFQGTAAHDADLAPPPAAPLQEGQIPAPTSHGHLLSTQPVLASTTSDLRPTHPTAGTQQAAWAGSNPADLTSSTTDQNGTATTQHPETGSRSPSRARTPAVPQPHSPTRVLSPVKSGTPTHGGGLMDGGVSCQNEAPAELSLSGDAVGRPATAPVFYSNAGGRAVQHQVDAGATGTSESGTGRGHAGTVFGGGDGMGVSVGSLSSGTSPGKARSGFTTFGSTIGTGAGEGQACSPTSPARAQSNFGAGGGYTLGSSGWGGGTAREAGMGSVAGGGTTTADLYRNLKGSGRFQHLKHPDTSHTVMPVPGSSQYLEPSARFVRKGDAPFTEFQEEDRERKVQLAQQKAKATESSLNFVAQQVAKSEEVAQNRDAANLASLGAAKQRYTERMQYLDQVRAADTAMQGSRLSVHFCSGQALGRSCFKEYLDSAAYFNRK